MNEYAALARYYDRFVGADYQKIITFIDHSIRQYYPDASLVCDIGCGSGTVTLGLLQLGYDMIGIDGSIDMLNEAMEKRADAANADRALFLCQQLPEFELYGTVDAIVSTLDTLNYLESEADLERLFFWFRNYLNPNGILIFDINTEYKYRRMLDNHCEAYEEEDVFMVWRSQFDSSVCNHQITIFSRNDAGYDRSDEEQIQRYFSPMKIQNLLEKYRFKILQITDDYSTKNPHTETQRLTYVVQKIGE